MTKKDLLNNLPDGYTLINISELPDKFNNMFRFRVKHICGNEYDTTYKNLISNKRRCNVCLVKNPRKLQTSKEDWDKLFESLNKENEYDLVDEYVNMSTKIRFKHNVCGQLFSSTPSAFKRGRRCSVCNPYRGFGSSTEVFAAKLKERIPYFTVISDYIRHDVNIKIRCEKCGHEFERRPHNLLRKTLACPHCELKSTSLGELQVRKHLQSLDLSFKEQVSFKGFFPNSSKAPFRFDFQVFLSEDFFFLIEYDGEQHFKEANKFGKTNYLEKMQKHDSIKDDFCKDKGVNLLRIPYTEFSNVEIIINEYIRTISSQAS